ncbi:unannotated protein [freshwater metagenome]|uniref:Unannotated protein n=1 Tax=freshwater metagenome TaxID=449393 RepID=A0A6J7HZB9_9ZZZZ
MRGLKTDRTVSMEIRGHAFVQKQLRGHYEQEVTVAQLLQLGPAFDELQLASG